MKRTDVRHPRRRPRRRSLAALQRHARGGLGSVPSAVPDAVTAMPSGPTSTPAPSELDEPVVGDPSDRADADAPGRRPPTPRPPTGETMIVRAYFVLGGEPGSVGLVPVLRDVPKTRGRRDRGDERAAGGPDDRPKPATGRSTTAIPDGHRPPRPDDQERRRDGGPLDRVRLGRRDGVDAVPAGPGRLHADPVHDRQVGRLPDRGPDRDRVRQRGHRPRRPGRPRRLRRPAAVDLRRPAGLRRRARQPGRVTGNADVFEATFRVAILDAGGQDARRPAGHGDVRDRLPRDVRRRRCRTPSARRSGARSGRTTRPSKDGTPAGRSATTRSG